MPSLYNPDGAGCPSISDDWPFHFLLIPAQLVPWWGHRPNGCGVIIRRPVLESIVLVLLVVMLGYIVVSMASAGEFGVTDLITLWAGAKIAMDGGNPYDAATLDRVYDSLPMDVGRQNRFWYPPWSLSLLIFFALFPISVLVPLWMLVNLLFSVLSVVLVFKIFHGDTIVRRAEHPRAVLLTIAVFVISCSPLAVEISTRSFMS